MVVYFWYDLKLIIGKWFRALLRRVPQSDPDVRLGWFIILGSVPIVALGLAQLGGLLIVLLSTGVLR